MKKLEILKGIIKDAVRPSLKTSMWLLKIMIPISLAVRLLQYYGVIEWCAQWLNPVFQYIGLPGASAIAFLTGASVTTYACLAVMLSMELTLREATILSIMVLICHALPMECAVVKKVGSKPFRMAVIRIAGAFLAAVYLNLVLPAMDTPFGGAATDVVAEVMTLTDVLCDWLLSSVRISLMIFGIIYSLMVVQQVMENFNIMVKLVRPLEPIMVFFGLPRHSAYLWLIGNVLGISYGSAMMIEMEDNGLITKEEANQVNYHLVMNHSMLEDTMVFATSGVSAIWILSTRILFAWLLVWGRRAVLKIKK